VGENALVRAHISLLTTPDEKQDLLFGAYICAQQIDGMWSAKEVGLFGRDGHPDPYEMWRSSRSHGYGQRNDRFNEKMVD
jgi:hypothetical protein